MLAEVADTATAERCAAALVRHFEGCQVYFPMARSTAAADEIRRLWNGRNTDALIRRFQITQPTFYRIVRGQQGAGSRALRRRGAVA